MRVLVCRGTRSIAVFVLAFVPGAAGHVDDPKGRDQLPPYLGAGYRRAVDDQVPQQFTGQGVELRAWLPLPEFNEPSQANDCWGYIAPSGREYAIIGLSRGTGFVEVTDPDMPHVVAVVPGPTSIWRDVKVSGHYAYVVSEAWSSGIQVINLAHIDGGVVHLVNTIVSGGATATHNVAIDTDSGYLYRCGGASHGLRIYSLQILQEPAYIASWDLRYVHDVQVVTYTDGPYAGRQIAFACSGFSGGYVEPGLDILDVTDKSNIIQIARLLYPNGKYAHQGWLSADRQYFYLGDELDEDGTLPTTTYVIDVSDLQNPRLADTFTNGNSAVGHNMYVRGDLLFESNYSSGLRVFDISNPLEATEIASFDTRPEDDSASYVGLWSNYPYFPSGTIIGSDRQRGLFVWRLASGSVFGDISGDGEVNLYDLILLLSAWGACPPPPAECPADLDGDGTVGLMDLLLLIHQMS